jgi:hypothetical protein
MASKGPADPANQGDHGHHVDDGQDAVLLPKKGPKRFPCLMT